jgi:hypothetical protein
VKNDEKRIITPTNKKTKKKIGIISKYFELLKLLYEKNGCLLQIKSYEFMIKKFLILILFTTTFGFAQYGYRDGNRIGISAGLSQTNLFTNNF